MKTIRRKRFAWAMWIAVGATAAAWAGAAGPMSAQTERGSHTHEAAPSAPNDGSKEAIRNVRRLMPRRVITVSGDEDWESMTGFGKDAAMAEMMTLMMVGGSGMEHMKMGPMKPGMKMADRPMRQPSGLPLTVTVTPNPPAVGDNTLDVVVTDPSGKPVTGLKLAVSVLMTNMDMGTTRPKVVEGAPGHYGTVVAFSMKGPWRVTLTITPPNRKLFMRSFDFDVK